jgi:LacI family transcriptional regulator
MDPDLIVAGEFLFDSGVSATHRLLKLRQRPTAVFASNDDMALGVLAAAHRQGLDVPGDLSIAGFDDSHATTLVWPPLTTVRQPMLEMASLAVDMLTRPRPTEADAGKPSGAVTHGVLPHLLMVRESTSAASGKVARAKAGKAALPGARQGGQSKVS